MGKIGNPAAANPVIPTGINSPYGIGLSDIIRN